MRLINIPVFALCWVSFASAGTPDTPATAGFAKAGFVTEFAAGGVRKLLGGNRDQFFVAKQDGSVDGVDSAGRKTLTLQAKDSAGVLTKIPHSPLRKDAEQALAQLQAVK